MCLTKKDGVIRLLQGISPKLDKRGSTMDRVQELIDEHRDQMPTGLAKTLLDACMEEHNRTTLYKIHFTHVVSVAYYGDEGPGSKLQSRTQTRIVELAETTCGCADQLLDNGQVCKQWLEATYPMRFHHGEDEVIIVHSIEPYLKRGR